jgi:hypothetical protein
MLIAVNFSARAHKISLPAASEVARTGTLMLSTDSQRAEERWTADHFHLGPDEGIVVRLE